MKSSKVFVLTAIRNDLVKTKLFLKSLEKQDYDNFDVYIVDDGSSDGSYEYIQRKYPMVKIIKGNGNLWWTGALTKGINKIIRIAKDNDYILTINNDCIFDKNYISSLVSVAEENPLYIVGSYIVDIKRRKIWDSGVYIKWDPLSFYEDFKRAREDVRRKIKFRKGFDTLPSKGTLFPVKLVRKIGSFDKDNFPHYLSDYEFFYRAKKNGYVLVVSYKSKLLNDIERTGLGADARKIISFKEYKDLLFSKKSRVNIKDHYNFVKIHSPSTYKIKNYIFVFGKIFHYLFHVYPLTLIPLVIYKVKKIFGLENSKLFKI